MTVKQHSKQKLIKGRIQGNRRGFAFLIRDDGEDLFVPVSALRGAQHGDLVVCEPIGGDQVAVKRIVERGITELIGTYVSTAYGYGYCTPDSKNYMTDVYIPNPPAKLKNQTKVLVEITAFDEGRQPTGKIKEILGTAGSIGVECISILRRFGFCETYPREVEQYAEKNIKEINSDRVDLRDLLTFTIDGDDAKDFDDAISIFATDTGYTLYVHIADVAHYVRPATPVDKEAYERGTSVYLPAKAYPMLPECLSNGACSLNPDVDRACMTAKIILDKECAVVDFEVFESVIKSDYRMTYRIVSAILQGDEERRREYERLVPTLHIALEVAGKLSAIRKSRGSIDFGNHECEIALNAKGYPVEMRTREYGVSNAIIEEMMILANECVAKYCYDNEIPCIYRIHDVPPTEKMNTLSGYLKSCGVTMPKGEITPKTLAETIESAREQTGSYVIDQLAVRCMAKAEYNEVNKGHFGLASVYYCHFTSPIRRYPDLTVHRMLKEYLHGKLTDRRKEKLSVTMSEVARQSTERERAAESCEREVDDYYKAIYMSGHLGESYKGVISGITTFGVFVELANTIEGMVPIEDFGLSARYYEESMELIARGKIYRLGDPLSVVVASVSEEERKIRFALGEGYEDDIPDDRKPRGKASSPKSAKKSSASKTKGSKTRSKSNASSRATARFVRTKAKRRKRK